MILETIIKRKKKYCETKIRKIVVVLSVVFIFFFIEAITRDLEQFKFGFNANEVRTDEKLLCNACKEYNIQCIQIYQN